MIIRRMHHAAAGSILLLALLATGCGHKDTVLAEIGDRTITSREFMDVVRGNETSYPMSADSARRMAFDDVVRRELMLVEALRRGMGENPEVQTFRQATEDRILVQELYLVEAPADLPVSDGEVRALHGWRDSTANVQLIYAPTREAIDAALVEIERGDPFEEIADRYNLPGTIPPGGRLGWRVSGDLVDPLDEQLRSAPIGSVTGPFQAPTEGWFLLKVLERKVNEQPPFEEQRQLLETMLRQRKQRELATKSYTALREDYGVTLSPGGAQDVFSFYNRQLQAAAHGTPHPDPTEEELQRALATYEDADGTTHTYTFADARKDMNSPGGQRPNLTIVPAIERWVESQVVRRAALLEARSRAMQNDPVIARKIEREVETYLVDGLFAEEVTAQVQVTEDDVRAAYERRRDVITESFEELAPTTRRGLQNDAAGQKSDEIFRSFTDHLKDTVEPFTVYEDRLSSIPWPIPEASK